MKIAKVNGFEVNKQAVGFELDRLVRFYMSHGMSMQEIKDIQEEKRVAFSSVSSRMGNKTIELSNISKSYGERKLMEDYNYILYHNMLDESTEEDIINDDNENFLGPKQDDEDYEIAAEDTLN